MVAVIETMLSVHPLTTCTYHWFEGDVAVLLKGGLALLLSCRSVIRDVSHMALFLVAVVTFDGTIVNGFFNLQKDSLEICVSR